ncbi:MAG TPA: CNNM domain-containing protein [Gemmatimonadaceae bacterium]|nr:CNNM domain-containing protein [Gemmatimonadaceae bacterium]
MTLLSLPLTIALLVVACLTAGGMSVRSVSRIWLRHWVERRLRGAGAAVTYLERPHRLLTAASAGVAVTLLIAGMAVGISASGVSVVLEALAFAGIVVVAGQLIPRAVARRWPAAVAPFVLPILRLAEILTLPILMVGRALARVFVRERPEAPPLADRDAIQDLLREGELEGVGDREEIKIISGVVDFSEKVVREVMTPRSDIFALPDGVDPHTLAKQIATSGYSRVPIYHGTLDTIVGMVHAFDVIKAHGEMPAALRPVASSAPEAPCTELLFRMLRDRLHLAIVRDDAARTVGLVTLEDLLEELVGDIRDEHDEPDAPRTTTTK